MMDIYKWMVIAIGIIIVFNLAGYETGSSIILEKFTTNLQENPENIKSSELYQALYILLGLATVGGATVGFFTRGPSTSLLLAAYCLILITFVTDMFFVITEAFNKADWTGYVALAILLPIAIGYLHSVAEFFKE